jgi:hypothetical protein
MLKVTPIKIYTSAIVKLREVSVNESFIYHDYHHKLIAKDDSFSLCKRTFDSKYSAISLEATVAAVNASPKLKDIPPGTLFRYTVPENATPYMKMHDDKVWHIATKCVYDHNIYSNDQVIIEGELTDAKD